MRVSGVDFRVNHGGVGCGVLLEAALRVVIVYSTSTGTALAISTFTPFVFAGSMVAWTIGYGTLQKRHTRALEGRRQGGGGGGETPPPRALQPREARRLR